jgi:hypothetical protein
MKLSSDAYSGWTNEGELETFRIATAGRATAGQMTVQYEIVSNPRLIRNGNISFPSCP